MDEFVAAQKMRGNDYADDGETELSADAQYMCEDERKAREGETTVGNRVGVVVA